jgi:hypothetical protein
VRQTLDGERLIASVKPKTIFHSVYVPSRLGRITCDAADLSGRGKSIAQFVLFFNAGAQFSVRRIQSSTVFPVRTEWSAASAMRRLRIASDM